MAAAYRDALAQPLDNYMKHSNALGGVVAEQAKLVQDAFNAQLYYLAVAEGRPEASMNENVSLLAPSKSKLEEIAALRDKHRGTPMFNHLSTISESIFALAWVTIPKTPTGYVKEMLDAGIFYGDKILTDSKITDKGPHRAWLAGWKELLTVLQKYVKEHHTTGLVWNRRPGCGKPLPFGGGSGGGELSAPPPPPPGPLPPPPPLADLSLDASTDRSALFAQINQGEGITHNLKKVTSEMQTHKNPGLRAGPAPFKAVAPVKADAPKPAPVHKPPTFTREGKKWLIEHHKGNHELVVTGTDMNNLVYIYGCSDSTLTIKGKVNSILVDSCKSTSILFDSVVSSIEFVNCRSTKMQVLGKVPTITIDKTDGCQMFLSKDSLDVEIVSSKSSEMNVLVPNESGEFTEMPIPEQYKTRVSGKALVTTPVESPFPC